MTDDEKTKVSQLIDAWKVTVDVQKHFNDLAMRIRAFALSFVGVVVGATGLAIQQKQPNLATSLAIVALLAWLAFWLMDGLWYHQLLKGSVKHGTKVEEVLKVITGLEAFDLTQAITASSHYQFKIGKKDHKKVLFELHSAGKLRVFYLVGFAAIVILLIVTRVVKPTPSVSENKPLNVMMMPDSTGEALPVRVIVIDSTNRRTPSRRR